jgi:multidrug resistance efflux pump
MFIALLALALLVLGIIVARDQQTYGSSLEEYISSRNPQHSGDIERLTVEYNQKVSRGQL